MASVLGRHPLIATTDVDAARSEVAARFCAHRLEPTNGAGSFDMLHNGVELSENVSIHYLRYGSEVRITPGRFENFYLLQLPLRGQARVQAGDRVVASDRHVGSLPSPTDPVDMVWSADCEQVLVYLRREVVESYGDDSAVTFDPRVDLRTPLMRSWVQLLRYATDDLGSGDGLLSAPLARSRFAEALICGLLNAQPNSTGLASASPVVMSRAVRRALDLLHDDPAREWQVTELARECGISVRSLQEAFRREHEATPLAVLRDIRLARAREDLLAAGAGITVTEVAGRWGFGHLSRFAQHYQAAYGEQPSATLAR